MYIVKFWACLKSLGSTVQSHVLTISLSPQESLESHVLSEGPPNPKENIPLRHLPTQIRVHNVISDKELRQICLDSIAAYSRFAYVRSISVAVRPRSHSGINVAKDVLL
eukprot:sb/3477469/